MAMKIGAARGKFNPNPQRSLVGVHFTFWVASHNRNRNPNRNPNRLARKRLRLGKDQNK
jgi:hypothetical protein